MAFSTSRQDSKQPFSEEQLMDSGGYLPLHSARTQRKVRFWKSVCFAVLVFITLNVIVRLFIEFYVVRRGGWKGPGSIAREWPEFSRGETSSCVDHSAWTHITDLDTRAVASDDMNAHFTDADVEAPYGSFATFTLPVDTDVLYFLSRGSLSSGSIKVDAIESNSEDIRVNVEARYWSRAALKQVVVCKLEKDDGDARGVGIFTPRVLQRVGPFDGLRFNVHVQIPVPASNSPRVVNALKTALANFHHEIGDTVDKLKFENLRLEATNAAVKIKSAFAEIAVIKTSNGIIDGSLNSSKSVELTTTNAHVNALVNLSSNKSGYHNNSTFCQIVSFDGTITSVVNLVSTDGTAHGTDSQFHVRTVGSNGPVKLAFPSQPPGAELIVDAMTTNAPLDVDLHPAFGGNFALNAREDGQVAVVDNKPSDPLGRGRERHIEYERRDSGLMFGSVKWEGNPWGNVLQFAHLATTNALITLTL